MSAHFLIVSWESARSWLLALELPCLGAAVKPDLLHSPVVCHALILVQLYKSFPLDRTLERDGLSHSLMLCSMSATSASGHQSFAEYDHDLSIVLRTMTCSLAM